VGGSSERPFNIIAASFAETRCKSISRVSTSRTDRPVSSEISSTDRPLAKASYTEMLRKVSMSSI
jgi:hypothetical protein